MSVRRAVVAVCAALAASAFVLGGSLIGQVRPPRVTALVYGQATSFRPDASSWVWRTRPDGTHPVRIAEGYAPELSPDGRWIVFLRRTRFPRTFSVEIRLARAAGGEPRTVRRYWATSVYAVEWFPGSDRLLVHEEERVAVMRRDGSRRRIVLGAAVSSVTISPDGSELAYEAWDQTGADVYVAAASGGRARRITRDHASGAPLWGPRGIAFTRGVSGDVWLMRPDGTGTRRLTRTGSGVFPAAWSSDGERLLAANPAIHNGRLWAVDLSSGRVRRLTGWIGDLFPQALSRDGQTVLAAIGCGGTISPIGRLIAIPFDGGEPTVIARGPCRGSWNA